MLTSHPTETDRVVAAQAGDRRALEDLLGARLPFVYTIVRRAMSGSPEVDDVVQETMLRALRELPRLNRPESFRAWLAAIAIRQISTHRHRGRRQASRTLTLDDLTEMEEAEAESVLGHPVEDAGVLHLHLADQRRQLVRARQWLAPDDQSVLSLWWLEATGRLTRSDLASALGVSIAHATVRVQRMHAQLELTRTLTAAIETRPRCPDLEVVLRGWSGRPESVWRKRILRHTRSCPTCLGTADGLIAPENLLLGAVLFPVPAALLDKVALGTSTIGGKTGIAAPLFQMGASKTVSAMLITGSVMTGAVAVTTNWPDSTSTPPVVVTVPPPVTTPSPVLTTTRRPEPSATPTNVASSPPVSVLTLSPGPVSLESVNYPGLFAGVSETYGVLDTAETQSEQARATFEVVEGLADPDCFSFRLGNGQYLRHSSWRLRTAIDDGTDLFHGDATFCRRAGSKPDSIALEASNYPGWFLRHRDGELWVDQDNGTERFAADRSFRVRAPLSD